MRLEMVVGLGWGGGMGAFGASCCYMEAPISGPYIAAYIEPI